MTLASLTRLLLLTSLTALVGWFAWRHFDAQITDAQRWKDPALPSTSLVSPAGLFNEAIDAGLILLSPSTEIEIAPRDLEIDTLPDEVSPWPAITRKNKSILVALYSTDSGVAIRRRVQAFNSDRQIVAVRDNATNATWDIKRVASTRGSYRSNSSDRPEHRLYASAARHSLRISTEITPAFNPWRTAKLTDDVVLQMSRKIAGDDPEVVIDVIGDVRGITLDGRSFAVSEAEVLEYHDKTCAAEPRFGMRYRLPRDRVVDRVFAVRIAANACGDQRRRIEGLTYLRHVPGYDENDFPTAVGRGPLQARCNARQQCVLRWEVKNESETPSKRNFSLDLASGFFPPPDPDLPGRPVARADLAPLVGVDADGLYSIYTLARSAYADVSAPSRPRITLLPELQAQVEEEVHRVVTDLATEGTVREIERRNQYLDERRVVIVLMDNSARGAGQVLAVGQSPIPNLLTSTWDLQAAAEGWPAASAISPLGWSQRNRLNTPGSTFKVVTALALAAAASDGDERIARALRGSASVDEIYRTLSIRPEDTGVVMRRDEKTTRDIANFDKLANREAMLRSADVTRQGVQIKGSGCPAVSDTNAPQLGVCEALAESLNSWFIHAALLLEFGESDPARIDPEMRIGSSRLASMYRRLFGQHARHLLTQREGRFGRYVNNGLQADLYNLRSGVLTGDPFVVAQNSIGQGVQITPLSLAALMSSVAHGRVVLPRLVGSGMEPPRAPLGVDGRYLDMIRAGMRAVVRVGTASGAFNTHPDIAARTRGKTGTAELGKKQPNIAWFSGYTNALGRQSRDISFACVITHVEEGGGALCAPAIARLLDRLHRL